MTANHRNSASGKATIGRPIVALHAEGRGTTPLILPEPQLIPQENREFITKYALGAYLVTDPACTSAVRSPTIQPKGWLSSFFEDENECI